MHRATLPLIGLALFAAACASTPAGPPTTIVDAAVTTTTSGPPTCTVTGIQPSRTGPFVDVQLRMLVAGQPDDPLWTIDFGGQFLREFALDGGTLYGSLKNGPLFALDAVTCEQLWNTPQVISAVGFVVGPRDLLVADDAAVAAYDRDTGVERWRHFPGLGTGTLVMADDLVTSGPAGSVLLVPLTGEPAVVAYDISSGDELYSVPIGTERATVGGVGATENRFYAASGTTVQAHDSLTGDIFWSTELDHTVSHPPSADDDLVVVSGRQTVSALDSATGEVRWSVSLPPGLLAQAGLDPDAVNVATLDGRILRLERDDGEVDEAAEYDSCCLVPGFDDSRLVINQGGRTKVLDLDGVERWSILTGANGGERLAAVTEQDDLIAVMIWGATGAR